jgi:hypothetical protein
LTYCSNWNSAFRDLLSLNAVQRQKRPLPFAKRRFADGALPTALANGALPTTLCQRRFANGALPTALCQRRFANGALPTAQRRHVPSARVWAERPIWPTSAAGLSGQQIDRTCHTLDGVERHEISANHSANVVGGQRGRVIAFSTVSSFPRTTPPFPVAVAPLAKRRWQSAVGKAPLAKRRWQSAVGKAPLAKRR